MPTYEYRCPKGHEFEIFQRITSEPGAACPECGEKAERQLSSGVGLLFKGSGFYITDYRSDSYKKSASSDKPADSGSTSKADSKTESKADSKSGATSKPKDSSSSSGGSGPSSSSGGSSGGSSKSGD